MTWAGVLVFIGLFAGIALVGAAWVGLMFMINGFAARIGLTNEQRDQIIAGVVVAGFVGGFAYVLGYVFLDWLFT